MNYTGKTLRAIRKQAGYTQADLAKRIGISRETVINIEKEKPETIKSLELQVVRKWWFLCSSKVDQDTKSSFVTMIRSLFSI